MENMLLNLMFGNYFLPAFGFLFSQNKGRFSPLQISLTVFVIKLWNKTWTLCRRVSHFGRQAKDDHFWVAFVCMAEGIKPSSKLRSDVCMAKNFSSLPTLKLALKKASNTTFEYRLPNIFLPDFQTFLWS